MDYYNIDSEIIETLNILRPPVKRDRRFGDDAYLGYIESDSQVELVTDYLEEDKQEEYCNLRERKSSISLILQKTSKTRIIEQYSLFSCQKSGIKHTIEERSSVQNKPTVKVTVIPKRERKPLIKHLKKHKRLTKTIRATCSNQENSIQSKNVFIIVAGQKEEKIYELKTTGSAKFTKDEFRDDINGLYYKQIYKTLEMERKKKKAAIKKNYSPTELNDSGSESPKSIRPCTCTYAGDNKMKDSMAGASRVRIYGRLGLNDHEKYILKCAATINDQPVLSYPRVDIKSSSDSISNIKSPVIDRIEKCNKETMTVKTEPPPINYSYNRIANIENLCRIINEEHDKRLLMQSDSFNNYNHAINTRKYYNKETQATQVDIDINVKKPIRTKDQSVQCCCKQINSSTESSSADTIERSNKESDSPLVIISVYPKQNAVKTIACPNTNMKHQLTTDKTIVQKEKSFDDNKQENINKNKTVKTQSSSRSPSPVKKSSKPKVQEHKQQIVAETRTIRTNARSRSPYKPQITSSINKQKQKDITVLKQEKIKSSTNKATTEKYRNKHFKNLSKSRDQGMNTDKILTRNMSVDKFNKTSNKQKQKIHNMVVKNNNISAEKLTKDFKRHDTKNDISKVSVNINSESEFYDVIFEQGKFKTDLLVRKQIKESGFQKDNNRMKSDSLENFLPDNNYCRERRSISQEFNSTVNDPLAEHTSRINFRDSLEIGHRREGKDHEIKDTQTKCGLEAHNNEADFLAPIKHFTGDDCIIYDPVVRDKEIRELLGIHRINKNQHTMSHYSTGFSGQYVFHNTICESLLAGMMLNKLCNCSACVTKKIATMDADINGARSEHVLGKTDIKKCDDLEAKYAIVTTSNKKIEETDKSDKIINNKTSQSTQYENMATEKSSNSEKFAKYRLHNCLIEANSKQKSIHLSRKQYSKVKKSIRKLSEKRQKGKMYWNSSMTSVADKVKTKSELVVHWDKEIQTDPVVLEIVECKPNKSKAAKNTGNYNEKTVVIFSRDVDGDKIKNVAINNEIRKIASSVEVRYASTAYVQKAACSFTNIGSLGSSKLERKKHSSIETLFRGYKKAHTPNLGASALSLVTEGDSKLVSKSDSVVHCDLKPRKAFLKRFMPCLVMRSERASDANNAPGFKRQPTLNSSVDSYHISTSLAAIEMTSSLYDTTASFYSTHMIGPLNNKMKRGFLNSVREFLTSQRKN